MIVKQLSVFLENKSGRLTEVLETLGRENLQIKASTIADTSEFGILRMIVNEPEKALQILKSSGFTANLTDVLSVATPTNSALLAKAIRLLSDENISIEYLYSFSAGEKEILIIRADDIEKAINTFKKYKMTLMKASDLYSF